MGFPLIYVEAEQVSCAVIALTVIGLFQIRCSAFSCV